MLDTNIISDLIRNPQGKAANDLWIAAHARTVGATIVTANSDAFKRVRGLNVENGLG